MGALNPSGTLPVICSPTLGQHPPIPVACAARALSHNGTHRTHPQPQRHAPHAPSATMACNSGMHRTYPQMRSTTTKADGEEGGSWCALQA